MSLPTPFDGELAPAVRALFPAAAGVPKAVRQRAEFFVFFAATVYPQLAQMSRLECARETIRLALAAIEKRGALPAAWTALWERYVESKVDPRSASEALKAKVRQAGEDLNLILAWAHEQGAVWAQAEPIQLLRRVCAENYEVDAQGALQQTRAQPPGAVHNPHEPEAQWSSKSTTKDKAWVGYKTQVAETVQDEPRARGEPTRSFITAIVTQNAIASDKPGLTEVLAEQASLGLAAPDDLYVDTAYVWGQSLKDAHDEGRDLRGPAPAAPDRGKIFTAEAFEVDVAGRSAVCPAGQPSTNCSRLEEARTDKVNFRLEWNDRLCGACPKRSQCVGPTQSHRTLVVGAHHRFLQDRRREMQTAGFKQEMHRRNAIEGTQSELVRGYGLRHARYRGLVKVRLQNYLIGAACNLRRLCRRLVWAAAQVNPACPTPLAAATA